MQEGYIKFRADWKTTPPLQHGAVAGLCHWRNEMYRLGLIGAYPDGIGFGNISQRIGNGSHFLISGSATGHLPCLDERHFCTVTGFDLLKNAVQCEGPIMASSESMSHAAIYATASSANAVIHAHHAGLWAFLLEKLPATEAGALYGSPEMAYAISDLIGDENIAREKIFAMKSHETGVIAFGPTLSLAAACLKKWLRNV